MTYEIRTTKITVLPKGEPLFHEGATEITIVDEAAGEYLEVSQCSDSHEGKIKIDRVEWPTLKAAIERIMKECR
jgi:hypothetical protein